MSDPFQQNNEVTRRKEAKEQDKAHQDALKKAAQARVSAQDAKAKLSPNSDIGYRWRPKFFEPGF
jgi:membrane protein involved in colicin uptake